MSHTNRKVLMLSTDQNLFKVDSPVYQRLLKTAEAVEELHVIVLTPKGVENAQPAPNIFLYPTNTRFKPLYYFSAFQLASKVLSKDQGDFFIDSQDGMTNILAVLLKVFYGAPLHVQIHTDFRSKFFLSHSFKNYLHAFGYRLGVFFADYIRVVSKRIEDSLRGVKGVVYRCPIAVQSEIVEPIVLRDKFNGFNKFVVMVSRLTSEKDMTTAFRVFAASTEENEHTALIILGEGDQKGRLMLLSQRLGISERVFFEGWQHPMRYLPNADVFLQTSLYEGYSASLMEAALAKCPIVSTNVGIVGDVLIPMESVYSCKQQDILCLTRGLTTLLANSDEANRLAENAYQSAQKATETSVRMYEPLL